MSAAQRVTLTKSEAMRVINEGGEVFAVAEANTFRLFSDPDAAREWADKLGVTHVLDWETGDYADA